MSNSVKRRRPIWQRVLLALVAIIALYLIIQGIRCAAAVRAGEERLAGYRAETAALSYGEMSYVDGGRADGPVILSVHGLFGGYDQAWDTVQDMAGDNRIIAPSRFGYPGSDVMGEGTPAEQAAAYVELLDHLGIERVYVLGTSAGGTVAIRFALDYPQRTSGLILYCSAAPPAEKPQTYTAYQAPPPFLSNDYPMFLISPLFRPIMGMDPDTIHSMMPISQRKVGVDIDGALTNPNMARNYDDYPIEALQVPTLIFHARDDQVASYEAIAQAARRFPDHSFISFDTGGHMMEGHGEEIRRALAAFVAAQAQ